MSEQTLKSNKGLYIAIDGIDASGKSSIAKELGLRTYPIIGGKATPVYVRVPGSTPFAERNRHSCLNEDVSSVTQALFYSALINDCMEKVIAPEKQKGNLVISDRSFGSTCVYQGISQDNLKGIWNIIKTADPVKADLTIYLSLPLKTALSRESGQNRSIDRYSSLDLIEKEKIKESYDLLYGVYPETSHIESYPDRDFDMKHTRFMLTKNNVAVVDATQPFNKVMADCYGIIIDTISNYNKSLSE